MVRARVSPSPEGTGGMANRLAQLVHRVKGAAVVPSRLPHPLGPLGGFAMGQPTRHHKKISTGPLPILSRRSSRGDPHRCPFGAQFGLVVARLAARTPDSSGAPGWIRTSDTFFRRVARTSFGR